MSPTATQDIAVIGNNNNKIAIRSPQQQQHDDDLNSTTSSCSTTTLSTIAVKSGQTKIVIALLKAGLKIDIKVQ